MRKLGPTPSPYTLALPYLTGIYPKNLSKSQGEVAHIAIAQHPANILDGKGGIPEQLFGADHPVLLEILVGRNSIDLAEQGFEPRGAHGG